MPSKPGPAHLHAIVKFDAVSHIGGKTFISLALSYIQPLRIGDFELGMESDDPAKDLACQSSKMLGKIL